MTHFTHTFDAIAQKCVYFLTKSGDTFSLVLAPASNMTIGGRAVGLMRTISLASKDTCVINSLRKAQRTKIIYEMLNKCNKVISTQKCTERFGLAT